jgi:hypothetical protein
MRLSMPESCVLRDGVALQYVDEPEIPEYYEEICVVAVLTTPPKKVTPAILAAVAVQQCASVRTY